MIRKRSISKKQLLKRSIPINMYIRDGELRVLDDENELLGVMGRNEALEIAQREGKDLVLIAQKAIPPVAKVIEFNKYLYLIAKKTKGEKKGKTDTKEIKIGLFMAQNDLDRLKRRATEFLDKGNQVRLSLWLKGRELGKKEQARAFLISFIQGIKSSKIVSEIAMHGKVLRTVISVDKSKNAKTEDQKVN